jgi:hypothetical protein
MKRQQNWLADISELFVQQGLQSQAHKSIMRRTPFDYVKNY